MNSIYEVIEYPDKLPVRCFLYSVESFRLHWHKEIEFLVVLKGSINVMLQDTTILLREGELAVVSSGLIHATQPTTEPNVLLVLQVNCERVSNLDEAIESQTFDIRGGDRRRRAALRATLCDIMLEMVYRQPGYQHKTLALVSDALAMLWRAFPHKPAQASDGGRLRERERIDRIVGYIDENYASRLSLNDIAKREHLSVNHLSTFIHKTLGMPFGDYVKYVRLKAYMEYLYTDVSASLDDIAIRCGFSSPQYATALFRETYQITPGKYRKRLSQMSLVRKKALDADAAMGYIPQYQPEDLSLVFKYARGGAQDVPAQGEAAGARLAFACGQETGVYCRSAARVFCIGRAHEGLMEETRRKIRLAKAAFHFEYLRFHGILSDDMMILRPEPSGSVGYSWRSVDMLLDFLRDIGVRPFIELTYMPSLLASGDKTVFLWRGNITPPADIHAWRRLVNMLVRHVVARYGEDEVRKWYFEVWNEPDYRDISWGGDMQAFFDFFADTAAAIRQALPGARVCGPSVSMASEDSHRWIGPFLDYCAQKNALPDALTLHAYPEIPRPDSLRDDIAGASQVDMTPQSVRGQDYVTRLLAAAQQQLKQRGLCMPVIASEWNITLKAFNPINDSAFAGTAMLKSALEADAPDVLLAHWTLDDYLEEQALPAGELCGGFGLLTCRGVRKPTYFAMRALAWLFPGVVARGEGLIITRRADEYRLLMFFHPETPLAFDIAYAQYAAPSAARAEAEDAGARRLTRIDIEPGEYALARWQYDAARCSPKALLRARGLNEPLCDEAAQWLRDAARPLYGEERVCVGDDSALTLDIMLRPCGFEAISIRRLTDGQTG